MKKRKMGLVFICIGIIIILLSSLFFLLNGKSKSSEEDSTKYSFVKSNDISLKSKVTFLIPNGLKPKESENDDFNSYYENEKGDFLSAYIVEETKTIPEYSEHVFNMNNEIYSKRGIKIISSDIECKYTCKKYTIYDKDDSLSAEEIRMFVKVSPSEVFDYVYHLEQEEFSNSTIEEIVNDINVSHDAKYTMGTINGDKLNLDFKINDEKYLSVVLDTKKYEELENKNSTSNTTFLRDKETSLVIYLSVLYKDSKISTKELINGLYNSGKDPVDETEIKLDKITIHKYEFEDYNCYIYEIDNNHILLMEVQEGMLDTRDFNSITIKNND